jgi:hypothetical protein
VESGTWKRIRADRRAECGRARADLLTSSAASSGVSPSLCTRVWNVERRSSCRPCARSSRPFARPSRPRRGCLGRSCGTCRASASCPCRPCWACSAACPGTGPRPWIGATGRPRLAGPAAGACTGPSYTDSTRRSSAGPRASLDLNSQQRVSSLLRRPLY